MGPSNGAHRKKIKVKILQGRRAMRGGNGGIGVKGRKKRIKYNRHKNVHRRKGLNE